MLDGFRVIFPGDVTVPAQAPFITTEGHCWALHPAATSGSLGARLLALEEGAGSQLCNWKGP